MWYANVNNDRENLKADNETFKGFMVDIRSRLDKLESKMDGLTQVVYQLIGVSKDKSENEVLAAESPLVLNDLGSTISREFGAEAWAEAYADNVREQAAGKHPYDLQRFCFDHVTEDLLTEDELLKAKDIAYGNGTNMFNVLRVLAYELKCCLLDPEPNQGQLRALG